MNKKLIILFISIIEVAIFMGSYLFPNLRLLTQIIIGSVVVLLSLYDIFIVIRGGQRPTISRTFYELCRDYPILGILFGILIGHLAVPQHPILSEL